jgi:hypothetical protein
MIYQYRPSVTKSDARLTDAFGVGTRYRYTMGLRCLLGHEYANREVEREREERGNEVVVTYRTVETCDRCGERRVVSENKEVRPVRNPAEDEVTTGLGGDGSGSVTPDLGGADDAPAPDAENAETQEPEPRPELESEPTPETVDPAGADPEPASESTSDPATDAGDDPETGTDDGGIILDDGPEDEDEGESDRRPGEWPEASDSESDDDDTTVVSGDEGWPEPAGEDEGFDAEPSDGEPTDVSFGGGMSPERVDGAANGGAETAAATNGTAGGSVGGKQFVAAETVEHVGEESDAETEFFCPNCGHARDAGGSSMRAGDICPDCHKGYIAERER